AKLDLAWNILLRRDNAKPSRPEGPPRRRKLRPIERVEEFRPNLHLHSTFPEYGNVLERGQIEVLHAPTTHIGERAGGVAESERRRLRENSRVKPLRESILRGPVSRQCGVPTNIRPLDR